MPTNHMARRARVRSRALLQPFGAAWGDVEQLTPGAPVVPIATRSQAYLEGIVSLSCLRYLHGDYLQEEINPAHRLPGVMNIVRVEAWPDSLRLTADTRGLETSIVRFNCDPWDNLDVGLRIRKNRDGVEFIHALQPGSVVVEGMPFQRFLQLHREVIGAHEHCIATLPPKNLTREEALARSARPQDWGASYRAASSVLRRLGVLSGARPRSVDWWCRPTRVTVEAWFRSLEPADVGRILSVLVSEHLAPRWTLVDRSGDLPGGIFEFTVAGTRSTVQVRLLS
jgi:hypothetical protein